MKKTSFFNNFIFSAVIILLIPFIVYSQETIKKFRIGTFDSRCVAIAYAKSDFLKNKDSDLRKEQAKAKAEGNETRVNELDKIGQHLQFILEQQVFSTGSVNNIIEKIKDKIPAIAEKNNVKLILSKWELFYHDESLEIVDITDQIVNLFNLDEQSRNSVEGIKKMEPIPMEQIFSESNK
jgi:hypothetical protein